APPYTCISYSWDSGKVDNMFEDGGLMSYRTLPVIEATIKASQKPENWGYALKSTPPDAQKEAAALAAALKAAQAIWIDALCVPSQEPARAACLRSMGAIYGSAAQVFAVLSEPCANPLHQISDKVPMTSEALFVLENDNWITRAWTYQEMANSKSTLFIAQGDGSVLLLALDFLNAILTDTSAYADAQGFERTQLAVRFPKLESLQVMMAEHRLVEYTGRSAYQVMSAMHQRVAERKEDRIYAMLGVITSLPSGGLHDAALHPAEYFMRACEEKGDYSFIYCTAPRSDIPGKGWRPVADQFQPVVAGLLAPSYGLTGCLKATHLQLDNMSRMSPGTLDSGAMNAIRAFVGSGIAGLSSGDIADVVLERLKQHGFSGCGEHLETENGYFFPQSTLTGSDEIFVVVSKDVQWTNGGPGLLVRSSDTDINHFCDVGAFVGKMPKVGESINVG
ncbi:MAG: HET domain-containing protein, partial [Sideroxyarcus sp.]|nr:HET domain-containing protein [Sideroxyarcus sp.]